MTLDSHTNTVFSRVCLLFNMASKTVIMTRSVDRFSLSGPVKVEKTVAGSMGETYQSIILFRLISCVLIRKGYLIELGQ